MRAYDSPEAQASVAAVEAQLSELDGLLREFYLRRGFTLSSPVGVWPRRRMWRRDEIDRCLDLTMDVGVREVFEQGFSAELPWSLYASGSLHPGTAPEVRIVSRAVFEHVPSAQLSSVLRASLDRALGILNATTAESIYAEGERFGRNAEPDAGGNSR
jgi:hypothetical protein